MNGESMPGAGDYLTMIANFAPIVILIVLFYFLLIRPQRKRDKAEREMRNSIEVGDEISTIGGFIGRVVNIKDDVLIIEDRKSTRLNSSHVSISYAVFCL